MPIVGCQRVASVEKGAVDAAPNAIAPAAQSAPVAQSAPSGSMQQGISTPEVQHARIADWHGALLPDSALWLQALVTSPFPTWPPLQQPLETDRLEFVIGKPSLREARSGTRSCAGPGPCRALVLPLKLHALRGPAVSLAFAREAQGGPFPWTPIHGCSRRLDGSDALALPWTCGPLYLADDVASEAMPKSPLSLLVTTNETPELSLRMDWRGTGSLETVPFVANAPGTYAGQIFIVFEEQGKHWVSGSKVFEIHLD